MYMYGVQSADASEQKKRLVIPGIGKIVAKGETDQAEFQLYSTDDRYAVLGVQLSCK